MKQNKDRLVGLTDIDPQLAELAREKEAQVRQTMTLVAGGSSVAATAAANARAAAAQQAATVEGQAAIEVLRANERADEAIRADFKQSRRGLRKVFTGPQSYMFFPLILFIMMPLLLSKGSHSGTLHTFMPILTMLMFPLIMLTIFLQNRKRKTLAPSLIRVILPAVARTPGEHSYAEAAGEVCEASQGTLGAPQAREMMRSLNSLLDSERTLDAQREAIDRAMNAQSLQAAEAERDRLSERLRATTDETARETLRESLELCEGRLEQTQRLAPALERIEAQQEAIRQVMASVRSSLAGLGVLATGGDHLTASASTVTAPQTAALRETTAQLQNRARAVEQAVQEVASLRVRA